MTHDQSTSSIPPNKIRMYKNQIRKLCAWYTDTILAENRNLNNRLVTPAFKLEVERALESVQQRQQKREPQSSAWKIPVKAVFSDDRHTFEVDIADYNKVLIIDFDNPYSY